MKDTIAFFGQPMQLPQRNIPTAEELYAKQVEAFNSHMQLGSETECKIENK